MARARIRPTRQDTMDRLIEGARRAFVDRGFYGASIEDICASAGLTRGAFYSAFGKKEDLFFALYDRMISDVSELFLAGLERAAHGEIDPIDALFEALAEHFPIGRAWYVLNAEFTLFAMRDAGAAKALAARRHALRMVIVEKLEVALTRSHRRATISPELFARAVIGIADAGLGQSLIEPDALHSTTLLRTFMAPLVRSLSVQVEDNADISTVGIPHISDAAGASQAKFSPPSQTGGNGRQRLLAAAQIVFLRDGYGKARLSDIAAMAGISKKTIYAHMPSKEALFAAVVREAIGRSVGADRSAQDENQDLGDMLRACLTHHARQCLSEPGIRLYGMIVAEAKQFPDLLQAYLEAARNVVCAELTAILTSGPGANFAPSQSPELAAGMLIEMAVAEPMRLAAFGITTRPDDIEIERRVEQAVAVFLDGTGMPRARA